MSMTKRIKCSRGEWRIVPSDWHYKECPICYARTEVRNANRYKRMSLPDIERKTIETLFKFEDAWKNYKKFCRIHKVKPMEKDKFREEWLFHQKPKIENVKKIIDKYNDRKAPLMSVECLEWRRLFSVRCSHLDYEKFSESLSAKDWNFFYNHAPKCESCNTYAILHEYDVPIETTEFHEATQKEFESGINDFFEAMKGKGDVDDAIAKMGFKPACGKCGSQLVNGECPKGCSDISPLSNISNEYDRRPQEPTPTQDPYLAELQRDYEEGKAEVERINKLSDRKINQWLNEKEEDT